MSAASEARDRLAALLPDHAVFAADNTPAMTRAMITMTVDQATALADRLAERDAAVTAVAVLTADLAIWRARAEKAKAEGAAAVAERDRLREVVARVEALRDRWTRMGVSSGWRLSLSYTDITANLERALGGAAPAADHESGAGDG